MPGHLMFHVVTSGGCWLQAQDMVPIRMEAGDLALIPHGEGHVLVGEPGVRVSMLGDTRREFVSSRYELLVHGGGGEEATMSSGWFHALKDPDVGHALRLIHRYPERPWTVESLAREVHMSRSALARRFTKLVGEAPLAYLTRWRMQLAAAWLQRGEVRVGELPARLGYASEASFSRAFKREMSVPPASYRGVS